MSFQIISACLVVGIYAIGLLMAVQINGGPVVSPVVTGVWNATISPVSVAYTGRHRATGVTRGRRGHQAAHRA